MLLKKWFRCSPALISILAVSECPKSSWKNCPACQARIKAEGLKTDKNHTAEERLQSYVIQRMEKMLAKHGKKIIGWDEILEGGLSPEATVMSWRGEAEVSLLLCRITMLL